MTLIEQQARALGAAIQQDEAYVRYQMARQANDEDAELQGHIGTFNLQRAALVSEQQKDDPDREKLQQINTALQEAYAAIMQNPHRVAYNAAKDEMDRVLGRVNAIISLCANGEDPDTCEPDACTGSCSTCGGCH